MARRPEWVRVVETAAGKRYEVRVHAQRQDGTRFQQRRRFRTVEEAVKWRTTVLSEVSHGTHVAPATFTVRQAVDAWLAGQRIRPKTRAAYVTSLRPVVDHLGDRPVQTVTKADIEGVVAALRDGTSKVGDWNAAAKLPKSAKTTRSPWSPASINPMLARLRAIWADLVAQGTVARNVAALVKPLPSTRPQMKTLSAEQVTALLTATAADPLHIAWQLACHGLRRGELAALRWNDVDLDVATLSITAARLATPGGPTTGAPKTSSSVRVLPLPPDLAAALRRERKRQLELQIRLGSRWPATDHVVVDELGVPPHPDTLSHAWRKALLDTGLPPVRLHDARHSCATLMHLNGVPAVVISAWLGHTDARFTLSVYAHSTDSALAAAAATFGGVVGRDAEAT